MPDQLPPTPGTGRCLCGAEYYFQRSGTIGKPGHFHCLRCGRRYRMRNEPWTPGRAVAEETPQR